jgi:hypothetical protein
MSPNPQSSASRSPLAARKPALGSRSRKGSEEATSARLPPSPCAIAQSNRRTQGSLSSPNVPVAGPAPTRFHAVQDEQVWAGVQGQPLVQPVEQRPVGGVRGEAGERRLQEPFDPRAIGQPPTEDAEGSRPLAQLDEHLGEQRALAAPGGTQHGEQPRRLGCLVDPVHDSAQLRFASDEGSGRVRPVGQSGPQEPRVAAQNHLGPQPQKIQEPGQ